MVRRHVEIKVSGFTNGEHWTMMELQKLIAHHAPFIGSNLKVMGCMVGFYDEDGNETLGQDAGQEIEQHPYVIQTDPTPDSQQNPLETRL